jgi:hypothetical protein
MVNLTGGNDWLEHIPMKKAGGIAAPKIRLNSEIRLARVYNIAGTGFATAPVASFNRETATETHTADVNRDRFPPSSSFYITHTRIATYPDTWPPQRPWAGFGDWPGVLQCHGATK